jgi:hypothetical protein
VNVLVKIANTRIGEKAGPTDVQEMAAKGKVQKTIVQEKLHKAKVLMNEAKEMAKQQSEEAKKAADQKMAEVSEILQLPPTWNKHDIGLKPEELFGQLDGIIEQMNIGVEVGEAYESDLEVVRKASGGRALCGIYHSEDDPPKTAELPLIEMPSELTLSSPNNAIQVEYEKFSQSRAAAKYVQLVKSSSSCIGRRIALLSPLSVGDVNESEASRCSKGMKKVFH